MQTNLNRFKLAQEEAYLRAYQELSEGKKKSHWMWYIFPQSKELGYSSMSKYYGINDIKEAIEYLEDETLYNNLVSLCQILLEKQEDNIIKIFGRIDALKLQSSMTLFSYAMDLIERKRIESETTGIPELFSKSSQYKQTDEVFDKVLNKFYNGKKCNKTESIIFFNQAPKTIAVFSPQLQKTKKPANMSL